jgi:hypothetical protein
MSTTETTTRERLLALYKELGNVWAEEGRAGVFACGAKAAERLGIDRRQLIIVVWLLAREWGDDSAAAGAISSYTAKVALLEHPQEGIGGEERAAYIAAVIALDFEHKLGGGHCLHCVDELALDHPGELSHFLASSLEMWPREVPDGD